MRNLQEIQSTSFDHLEDKQASVSGTRPAASTVVLWAWDEMLHAFWTKIRFPDYTSRNRPVRKRPKKCHCGVRPSESRYSYPPMQFRPGLDHPVASRITCVASWG